MPKPAKARPPDDAEQSARFISAAKEREAEEKGDAFEKAMKVIAPVRSGQQPTPKRKPKA